ncbi:phosphoribosylanthranilate isomerase [Oscillatoriales cyanobacterium LEGE 11467]|uniref:N-(5'-phosphoribosyl)anthranilate isomerase n=1 Tax=Zarconia navalis LEGE 11467 TaxID=1828826 RepID=A0A928VXB8_9CYAN|nr:phosphoribosylanthranilate isomerase [Zarconia navalis]MBE9039991.1 phosphoribosylanthranilate isomerase [Zarconia navalis LEGE 11467]
MLRVKICGITQPEQGREIVRLGATALGFICVEASPRYVSPEKIREIIRQLPPKPVTLIGVFANATLDRIIDTVKFAGLTGVQLHGDESPEFCRQVRATLAQVETIKALRVKTTAALATIAPYAEVVDALLLDAYHPQQLGGTGKTLDWQALQQFRPPLPWFLAGGLNPDNIGEALSQVQPDGIDLSSGIERSPGEKDLHEVARLFEGLRPYFANPIGKEL